MEFEVSVKDGSRTYVSIGKEIIEVRVLVLLVRWSLDDAFEYSAVYLTITKPIYLFEPKLSYSTKDSTNLTQISICD